MYIYLYLSITSLNLQGTAFSRTRRTIRPPIRLSPSASCFRFFRSCEGTPCTEPPPGTWVTGASRQHLSMHDSCPSWASCWDMRSSARTSMGSRDQRRSGPDLLGLPIPPRSNHLEARAPRRPFLPLPISISISVPRVASEPPSRPPPPLPPSPSAHVLALVMTYSTSTPASIMPVTTDRSPWQGMRLSVMKGKGMRRSGLRLNNLDPPL